MKRAVGSALVLAYIGIGIWAVQAEQQPEAARASAADGPRYADGKNLIRPDEYREWVFVGSGLDMTYEAPGTRPAGRQMFSSVFVNPAAYRHFMKTGTWPNGSVFVLEIRAAGSEGAINNNTTARYQAGLAALEAEVKDSRFPDGWAYFDFGSASNLRSSAEPLAGERVARCIECHTKHTAVERTFVQFYPTLLDVARTMGTVKPGFAAAPPAAASAPANPEAERVRQRLVGSYKLTSYTTYDAKGQASNSPFTMGQISYDAAGRMAAHLMTEERRKLAADQRTAGQRGGGTGSTPTPSAAGYLSYYGRYEIDAKQASVTHHVEGSSNLGFIGSALVRYYELTPDGRTLFLTTKTGDRITGRLRWDRH